MKKDLHPANYRPVAFKDMSNDDTFITKSTINTKEKPGVDVCSLAKMSSVSLWLPANALPSIDITFNDISYCGVSVKECGIVTAKE